MAGLLMGWEFAQKFPKYLEKLQSAAELIARPMPLQKPKACCLFLVVIHP